MTVPACLPSGRNETRMIGSPPGRVAIPRGEASGRRPETSAGCEPTAAGEAAEREETEEVDQLYRQLETETEQDQEAAAED